MIKFVSDQSVLGLDIGERIGLNAARFERFSEAFYVEIQAKFL